MTAYFVIQGPGSTQWHPADWRLTSDGGVLTVDPSANWPTSPTGLSAGQLYSNSGAASMVLGITSNSTLLLYFTEVSASYLLSQNLGNIPIIPGPTGSGLLWSNGGLISIS